jgi:hypothetical protein
MSQLVRKVLDLLIGVEPGAGIHVSLPAPASSKPRKVASSVSERELIQRESQIGAQLFGRIPKGHRREFFNLDPSTWIWYDEWIDAQTGNRVSTTIRYEIHENGILKVQEGARYDFIEGQERDNFLAAVQLYYDRVSREMYHHEPTIRVSMPRAV